MSESRAARAAGAAASTRRASRATSRSKAAGRLSVVRRREERGCAPGDTEMIELKMLTSNLGFAQDQDVRRMPPVPTRGRCPVQSTRLAFSLGDGDAQSVRVMSQKNGSPASSPVNDPDEYYMLNEM